jgi:hypothetical protein
MSMKWRFWEFELVGLDWIISREWDAEYAHHRGVWIRYCRVKSGGVFLVSVH